MLSGQVVGDLLDGNNRSVHPMHGTREAVVIHLQTGKNYFQVYRQSSSQGPVDWCDSRAWQAIYFLDIVF